MGSYNIFHFVKVVKGARREIAAGNAAILILLPSPTVWQQISAEALPPPNRWIRIESFEGIQFDEFLSNRARNNGFMKRVGILTGREITFPDAIISAINERGGGDVTAEMITVGGIRLDEP